MKTAFFKPSNRLVLFTLGFVFLATLLSARPLSGSSPSRLVVVTPGPLISLDPCDYRQRETQAILKNLFDSLTTRDAQMRVVPQLAESWRAVSDTVWEFNLRKGVKFHNGDDFSAADVKFTFDRILTEGGLDGQKSSPRRSLLGPTSNVAVVDAYTVRIKTATPWPILPLMLSLQEIMPQNYTRRNGYKGFQLAPVGSGPFQFVSFNKKELVLKRFEAYYGGSPANPPVQIAPVKYLIFKIVPSQVERIAELKKGACDIITHLSVDAIPALKLSTAIRVIAAPASRSYFAELNCMKYPFNDRRIRLAMNYGINKENMVNLLLKGQGQVLPTVLIPQATGYNGNIRAYDFNPGLARSLLQETHFPNWYPIKIYTTPNNSQFANVLATFLSHLGLKYSIHITDVDEARGAMIKLTGDVLVGSWGNSSLDPSGIILPKFKSSGRGNFSNYNNPEVDSLLAKAESTLSPQDRIAYYKRIQEIIHQDVPMIFGYSAKEFYGLGPPVRNFNPSASGMLNMHDVYRVKKEG